MSRATIADVAARAGVSPMTVSNVLNDRPGASDATREKVLRSVNELGYVPNASARRLKSGKTGLVGVVLPELTSPYALEITRGIADELVGPGLELLISAIHLDGNSERSRLEIFSRGMTDGILLVAPVLTAEVLAVLRRINQPVVVADPRRFDCPYPHVVAGNYEGMRSMTERVLAQGHRDILFLEGDPGFDSSAARKSGFSEAVVLAGIPTDHIAYRGSSHRYVDALQVTSTFLGEHLPTAIIASSDNQAFGALDAVRAMGHRVPDDISVVGFDDLPQAANSFPGLTTVRQPLHEMGRIAARTLLSLLEGVKPIQDRVELRTTLVERGSLGVPRSEEG